MKLRVGSGLPNIQMNALKTMVFSFPTKKIERSRITAILSKYDKEIKLLEENLKQENQKKKALMQLLLTGIVRVNNE